MTTLSRNLLETAIRISNSCSKDETRLHLTGVHIFKRDDSIILEAVDGYILAREILPNDISDIAEHDLILDAKELKKLKPLLKTWKGKDSFDAEINERNVIVSVGTDVVSIYRIAREFPKTDMVIPKNRPNTVTVGINPEYLLNLFESLKLNKGQVSVELELDISNLTGPIKVSVMNTVKNEGGQMVTTLNPEQTGVIMPVKGINTGVKGKLVEEKSKRKSSEVA